MKKKDLNKFFFNYITDNINNINFFTDCSGFEIDHGQECLLFDDSKIDDDKCLIFWDHHNTRVHELFFQNCSIDLQNLINNINTFHKL